MLRSFLLNALFPPRCPTCHASVEAADSFCKACFGQIHFITRPACAICGHPFEYAQGEGALCGECMAESPPFNKGWSALKYDEHSRKLVTRLKYADRTELAALCSRLMLSSGEHVLEGADYLVPVPLHWRRMMLRRFNQSVLLARELGGKASVPVMPDGLQRIRHTPQQAGLSKAEREANLRGAFRVHPKRKALLQGKILILIDDVMTTGTTIQMCVKALKKAKPAEIRVFTLARRVLVD